MRDRASLARIEGDGSVENVYRLQIMNASEAAQRFRIDVVGLPGATLAGGAPIVDIEGAAARWVPVAVQVPFAGAKGAGSGAHRIDFLITRMADGAERTVQEKSTFVIPR